MNLIRLLQGNAQPEVDLCAHLRRGRHRLRRRGRHGGARADVPGHEGPDARGRQEARHQQGAQVDGVALRPPAPRRHAARASCADAQRIHDPSAARTRPARSTARSTRTCRAGAAPTTRRTSSSTRRNIRTRAPTTPGCARGVSAARRTSGAASRCACPTTTSRPRVVTATATTGRLATRTSSRTTTGSISISGSPASRRICRTCPTACSSGRRDWRRAEVTLRNSLKKMNRVLTPYRAGVTTDGLKHNKYRSRCFGRGACNRRAGGCDIHAAFDSPTGLIYPAMDTGNLTLRTNSIAREILVDPKTGKARGVAVRRQRDAAARYEARAQGRHRGRLDARIGAAAAAVEIRHASQRHRQLERPRRPQLLRARHGSRRHRAGQGSHRLAEDDRRRAAGRLLRAALPKSRRTSRAKFIRGYGFEGSAGSRMFPENAPSTPGFGAAYKKTVRDYSGRVHREWVASAKSSPATRTRSSLDPARKDKWGIPVAPLQLHVRRQRKEDVRGHGQHGAGDVRAGRLRDRQRRIERC